jgi:peptidoglycan/LPS O-acetylase OafA/YrhL
VVILRRRIDLLMIALFIVQLCLFRTPLLMSVRTDALALGVLLAIAAPGKAYAALNPRFLLRLRSLRMLLPGLLLAALAVLASADLQGWRFRISAIALLSTVLVWLASYNQNYLLRDGWCKRLLVWTGARSYAIYLIHVPVYFLLRELCFRFSSPAGMALRLPTWLLFLLSVGLIALLAELNYRYLEQPLRQYGRHLADRFEHRWTYSRSGADAAIAPPVLASSAEYPT